MVPDSLEKMRNERLAQEHKLWYRRELLLLKTAKSVIANLTPPNNHPAACIPALNEIAKIPFPPNLIKKNPWFMEVCAVCDFSSWLIF